jgi:hypothetical protein
MQRLVLGVMALALLLGSRGQARAGNLIVNGGFETGDFTAWTTGANSYPEYIVKSPVHSGTYAAQIAGFSYLPDTLSQTVATTSGQTYTLSFARYQNYLSPTVFLTVAWDGTTVFTDPDPTVGGVYQTFSVNVVGTGSDTVTFVSANDPAFTYLDDVSLTAVPEPASLGLLGIGSLTLLGYGWRRRQQVKV